MSLKNEISRRAAQFQYLWMGRPQTILFYGCGLGDDVLLTGVAHELRKRGAGRIVVLSRFSSLFEQSPDVSGAYAFGHPSMSRLRHWGYNCITPFYGSYDSVTDRDVFPHEHLLATMCRVAGITGTIDLRPYLTLLADEKKAGQFFERQAVIQSSGLAVGPGVMKNKDWLPDRFQAVSDEVGGSAGLIQLGQKTDPPIQGALDLRGKTTLRESAAILASSRVFIGQVGFLMHLARAVDCRSVIVFGGREDPLVSGYRVNENIVGRTPCSFCWQRNKCDYNRECMRMIGVDEVAAAVRRQLEREGTPLEVDRVNLDSPQVSVSSNQSPKSAF